MKYDDTKYRNKPNSMKIWLKNTHQQNIMGNYICVYLCMCVEEKYANFRPTNQAKTLLVNPVLWVCSLLNYVWKLHDERSSISIWINIDFSIIKLRLITVVGRPPIVCGLTFSFSFWFWIEFSLSFLFSFSLRTCYFFVVVVLVWYSCSVLFQLELVLILLLSYLFLFLLIRISILEFIVPSTTYFTIEISFPLNPKAKGTPIQFESNKCKEKQKQIIRRRYQCAEIHSSAQVIENCSIFNAKIMQNIS